VARGKKTRHFGDARHAVLDTAWKRPRSVAVSPHGKFMAVGGAFGALQILRVADGKTLRRLGHGNELKEGLLVQYSRSGDLLASAGHDLNRIRVWDPDTGKLKREWTAQTRQISTIALAGEKVLMIGGVGGRVEAFDMGSGSPKGKFRMRYRQRVAALDTDRAGGWAAAADLSGEVEIYNLRTWQRVGRVRAGKRLSAVALAPAGDKLALALSSGVVRFHNLPFGERDKRLTLRLESRVETLRFSPDGKYLAAAMQNSALELIELEKARTVDRLRGAGKPLLDLSFGKKNKFLAAVELGRGVHVWWRPEADISVRIRRRARARRSRKSRPRPRIPRSLQRRRATVIRPSFDISRAAVDRRGRFVSATGLPHKVAVWETHQGKRLWISKKAPGHVSYRRRPPGGKKRPVMVRFRPHSSRVFAFGRENRIYRWTVRSGKYIRYLVNPKGTLRALLFAQNGLSYFALLDDGRVRHYTLRGRLKKTFRTLSKPFWMAVCPTGQRFAAVAGWDEIAMHETRRGKRIWHRPSGRLSRYEVLATRFDRRCKRFLTYHKTGFVRFFDARSGDLIQRRFVEFPVAAKSCALHPGLRWLTCGWARRVEVRAVNDGRRLVRLTVPVGVPGQIESLFYNLKGDTLVAQVGKRALVVWRFDEGRQVETKRSRQPSPRDVQPGRRPNIGPARTRPRVPRIYFPRPRPLRRKQPNLKQKGFEADVDDQQANGKKHKNSRARPRSKPKPPSR
jgi:WD40 repeat protein